MPTTQTKTAEVTTQPATAVNNLNLRPPNSDVPPNIELTIIITDYKYRSNHITDQGLPTA